MAGTRSPHVDIDNLSTHKVANVNIGHPGASDHALFQPISTACSGWHLPAASSRRPFEPRPVQTVASPSSPSIRWSLNMRFSLLFALLCLPAASQRRAGRTPAGPHARRRSQIHRRRPPRDRRGQAALRERSVIPRRRQGALAAVDVGASVKKGETLATLDTQDYQNRLRSAEADVRFAEAALVEAQGNEGRKAKLLKDGWTPQATYDTAAEQPPRRRSQAHCRQGQSRSHQRPAQLH